ncbi:MAG: DUF4145 domain-containing protein [Nitrospinae bacterium]|nr:DUF4145 domain-containing protein [Nitrospinota bacterium]
MGIQWTCAYCNRPCTVGPDNIRLITGNNQINEKYGSYQSTTKVIVCPNPECEQQTISLTIRKWDETCPVPVRGVLYSWNLLPESEAKPYPNYIPEQLRGDYKEACLIKTKSPKASATLSRRCLQGTIRNFWGIQKDRLFDEVEELKTKVDSQTWTAIDSVRKVGNIGAHMEKDVNLIIDVEPEEAGLLIWLNETLFEEWYIARHERDTKMTALAVMAGKKKPPKAST